MKTVYRSNTYVPNLVSECKKNAEKAGFTNSCTNEFGRFLYTLVGQVKGSILEIGTGYGVSTAWIISAMSSEVNLVSVDINQEQVSHSNQLLHQKGIEFMCGDWKELLKRGPYNFIFADVRDAKRENAEKLFDSMAVGGMLVMDDFTPEEYWPEDWKGKPDTIREFWLNHPKLAATEILVTPREAVIVASKLSE
jgi:predicted O-methyltransferase YrrM